MRLCSSLPNPEVFDIGGCGPPQPPLLPRQARRRKPRAFCVPGPAPGCARCRPKSGCLLDADHHIKSTACRYFAGESMVSCREASFHECATFVLLASVLYRSRVACYNRAPTEGEAFGRPSMQVGGRTGEHHMVVSPTECLECVRVSSTEVSTAMLGSKAAVAAGDDILVVTLLMFAVAALFIFSSWES